MREARNRQGWTPLEMLVVAVIIVLLMLLLISVFWSAQHGAPSRLQALSNMKSILGTTIAYSSDEGRGLGCGDQPMSEDEAQMVYVGRCFLLLAKSEELPSKLFQHPQETTELPSEISPGVSLRDANIQQIASCNPSVAKAWARTYAFDWTKGTRANASGAVVLAERDPDRWGKTAHESKTAVCYGDGHGGNVALSPSNTSKTLRLNAKGKTELVPYASADDNIYGPDSSRSATDSWVR